MATKKLIINNKEVDIDKQITTSIKWLNDHGYTTLYSCSGHSKKEPLYIVFKDLVSLRLDKLLAALNKYSNENLIYDGHNRYHFELEGSGRFKTLRKIIRELKYLEPMQKIPLNYFG